MWDSAASGALIDAEAGMPVPETFRPIAQELARDLRPGAVRHQGLKSGRISPP